MSGVSWKQQQAREPNWIKQHINKNIAVAMHQDYFEMVYQMYCKTLHKMQFEKALEIGISDTGGYLAIIRGIRKKYAIDSMTDVLRDMDMLPFMSKIRYVQGFAEDLPYGDKSFDLVIISNALDHVIDMKKAVEEIERVIKPGGLVLFQTFLKVKKPHPWTFNSVGEARNMFQNFKVIESNHVIPDLPYNRRNEYYVAILKYK